MLWAASPATKIFNLGESGNKLALFFNNTKDSLTAWRATSRCSSLPTNSVLPEKSRLAGLGLLNKPARNLTRRIRLTASSMRACGITPCLTCAIVFSINGFQASVGTMKTSRPAFAACGQLSFVQSTICP